MKNITNRKQFHKGFVLKFVLAVILCFGVICSGCEKKSADIDQLDNGQGKKTILCTTFAAYDWARNIVGNSENMIVELLVDTGVDLHSYQPKAQDIVRIAHCDVLIYVGGESDTWVADAIEQSGNSSLMFVNMMELVDEYALCEEEIQIGDEKIEEMDEEIEYDEHIWLSIFHAKKICQELTRVFSSLDPNNQEIYNQNCEAYLRSLDELDSEYKNVVEQSKLNTILVGDRFPFLYLVKSYNIQYFAAYSGCSADAEASVRMVTYLADCMGKYELPVVFIVDNGKDDLAKTVIECADMKNDSKEYNLSPVILRLNSMQSVTKEQIDAGDTYISIMKENLENLKQGLRYN